MEKVKYIFVIVVFRNGEDLYELDASIKKFINSYKIIVVNSYFNEETANRIKQISNELNCVYINIENKGYGYGNNKGIEYANKNYKYDYLIISNSDIEIQEFSESSFPTTNAVMGPDIKTLNGKNQNPYQAIKNNFISKLYYYGFKYKKRYFYFAIIINKLFREAYRLIKKFPKRIYNVYAIHGAFLIFTKDVIDKLCPIYDENMFLYNEEIFLAYRLKKENIDCFVNPFIKVLHKEDGSTKGLKFDTNKYSRESYIYFYEKYIKKN